METIVHNNPLYDTSIQIDEDDISEYEYNGGTVTKGRSQPRDSQTTPKRCSTTFPSPPNPAKRQVTNTAINRARSEPICID